MAIHGTEREAQRRRDYIKSEFMLVGMRIEDIEGKLADLRRRLDTAERMLTREIASGHSGADITMEGGA